MTVMPKLFVIIPRDHLRVAVQKVIRGTVGIAQVRFIDIHRDILIIMKHFIAPYPMAHGALQSLAWDLDARILRIKAPYSLRYLYK